MKKLNKILLSILGGIDVVVIVITPILLILVWLSIFGIKNHWSSYVLIIIACLSSLFRGIKIGWIKR